MIDTLISRNKTFAAEGVHEGLRMMPALRTIVIGCADPRVDPADVLGLRLGEALVIRNIGGRVVPSTLQTLGLLGMIGQASGVAAGPEWNLVVLHHTDCGITRLGPEALDAYFGGAAKDIADPRATVAADVAALKATAGPWLVSGLVYDVTTGVVDVVAEPV